MKKLLLLFSLFLATSCSKIEYNVSASDVVVPKPNSVVMGDDAIAIDQTVVIESTNADVTAKYLENELAQRFSIANGKSGKSISIVVDTTSGIADQGYKMNIARKGVEITASSEAGAFYGVQTLLQLLAAGASEQGYLLSYQQIDDVPRFGWRSFLLDEARYFYGVPQIYKMLDAMAELKMNVLHWHLTDDAGWRIEIKKYPLLTSVGSKRKDTETGTWGSGKTSGEPHEGFYTQEQIKEIVAYAKERNIKIVPEIEMPGHASAAIAAYPWLGTSGEKIEVPVKFGKLYNVYDVINPEVEQFLKDVLSETIELFGTDVVHIGGDEVRFDHWEKDKDMIAYKNKNNFASFMDIQIEFTNKMSYFLEEKGISMMGWNEILGQNLHSDDNISFAETSTKIAPNVIVQFWKGDLDWLSAAAAGGYKLVNSHHQFTYLDYSYDNISLQKAYTFDPIPEGLDAKYHSNIVGPGCQMWTEWTPTAADMEAKAFPRIAAYAEVGWSNMDVKNFDNFVSRLKPVVEGWRTKGINVYQCEELNESTVL